MARNPLVRKRKAGKWHMTEKQLANLRPVGPGNKLGEKNKKPFFGYRKWSTVLKELIAGSERAKDFFEKKTGVRLPEAISEKNLQDIVMGVLVAQALKGNIKAVEMLMDRTDGKPKETVDTNPPAESIALDELAPELKADVLREELKKLEAAEGEAPCATTPES